MHTSRQMFWVLVIDEILCYRWIPFTDSHTIGHPESYRPPSSGCSFSMRQLMQFLKTLACPTLMEIWFYINPFKYPKYTNTHSRYFADAAPISWNLSRRAGSLIAMSTLFKVKFSCFDLKYTKVSNCTLREGNFKYLFDPLTTCQIYTFFISYLF